MTITASKKEDEILLQIEGRVDTNTSSELQTEILNGFQKQNKLTLDFEKVVYVSSAGLRALLIGQKTAVSKGGIMKLIHVPEIVMSVFEMSGFADILTIE